MDPLLGFSARAAALFSSLGDQVPAAPMLSYTPPVAGNSNPNDGSSEDEGDGDWRGDAPEPSLVPWSVVTDGETGPSGAGLMEPSKASRRAFEDEPEEDEFDFIAAGSLRKNNPEELPPRGMEVMPDNAWDRKYGGRTPDALGAGSKAIEGGKQVKYNKSVDAGCSKSGKPMRPSTSHRKGLPVRQPSYVPHHVRHPEKYICYTLDEPLIVGGGTQGQSNSIQDIKDMRLAAERICDTVDTPKDEDKFVPRFGSGMEFRPKVGSKSTYNPGPNPITAEKKWLKVSLSDDEEEEVNGEQESTRMECEDLGTAFRQRSGGKRRQYRSHNRKSEGRLGVDR